MKSAFLYLARTRGKLLSSLLFVFLCLLLFSCGHKHSSTASISSISEAASARHQPKTLDQGIKDLEALPTPPGVDPAKFQAMKDDLKRELIARNGGKQILVQHAPAKDVDKVDLIAGGSYLTGNVSLSWLEKLNGDYKDDAIVYVDDLAPLAQYGDQDPLLRTDSGAYDAHRLVVGDENPEITYIGDMPPIGDNYDASIDGYKVWRLLDQNSSWVNIGTVDRDDETHVTTYTYSRPKYTYTDSNLGQQYQATVQYKVRPYWGTDTTTGTWSDPQQPTWTTYTVSGTVLDQQSRGVFGVSMSLYVIPGSTVPKYQATTGVNGIYTVTNVKPGSYYLIPQKPGYTFNPWERSVTVTSSNVTGQDFTAGTSSGFSVSGQITNSYDADLGMYNVTVVLVAENGTESTTYTDSSGDFSFTGMAAGAYKAYISKAGCRFEGDIYSIVTVQNANVANILLHGWGILAASPWPKFRGNSYSTGQASGNGPLTEPDTYKWRFQTSGEVTSSPAVGGDGEVYVGSHDTNFYAIDPSDGTQDWTYDTGGAIESSPAVAGDETVYVGSDDNYLYALNTTSTGNRVRWSFSTGGDVKSAPTIGPDGIIYVGSSDGYVYALRPTASPDSNRVKWSYQTGGAIVSSPAIGPDGTIYVGSDDHYIYALNPSDGSLKWSFDTGDIVRSSPAVSYGSNVVYVATDGFDLGYQYVYALDGSDGSEIWTSPFPSSAFGSFYSSPAVSLDGTRVYICATGADTNLYAIEASTGDEDWYYSLTSLGSQSSITIGADGTLYVGTLDGTGQSSLFAITPGETSGTLLWDYATGSGISSSPAIIPNPDDPTEAGTLYVGCSDNYLYAFGT